MNTISRGMMAPLVAWLTEECQPEGLPLCDYDRLSEKLQPADVLLVEGRTRVSGVIQTVTLSSWSHAALYLGRAGELGALRAQLEKAGGRAWEDDRQLLAEAELGRGTLVMPLDRYRGFHLRICRPQYLLAEDVQAVLKYTLDRLGTAYDLRQIIDLLRFFFPYGLLPRRWRSSLFEAAHGEPTRTVCSTLIARAFASVRYPILPQVQRAADGGYVFKRRNSKLFTPRDFDYSPYFEIIKYPFLGDDVAMYRQLNWDGYEVESQQDLPRAG